MKLCLAQINPLVGDLPGNVEACLAAAHRARGQGADVLLLPELALPGGAARDILLDASFLEALDAAARDLARRAPSGLALLAGSILPAESAGRPAGHPGLFSAALCLQNGRVSLAAARRILRSGDVFHESRWFLPGPASTPLTLAGRRVGVLLGADLLESAPGLDPAAELKAGGAQVLLCLAAEPFVSGDFELRLQKARACGLPLAFCNLAGGSDELIYDGRSFALGADGAPRALLKAFAKDLALADLDAPDPGLPLPSAAWEEETFQALALGVRDFLGKNRLEHAFLGISGGIDSALTALIACEALGAGRVTAVSIPSRHTDPHSVESARQLCAALGCGFEVRPLEPLHRAAEQSLEGLLDSGTGAENIQARLRALVLMAYVNRRGGLLLNTTNKTELSVGYITLYGDMAGMLCPLGDLTKPEVYRLARWANARRKVIPDFILERPPSAELRPGQVDPFDYERISPQLEALVQSNQCNEALRRSEYKRRQMGVILKVSRKAFGSGRMMPVTCR